MVLLSARVEGTGSENNPDQAGPSAMARRRVGSIRKASIRSEQPRERSRVHEMQGEGTATCAKSPRWLDHARARFSGPRGQRRP